MLQKAEPKHYDDYYHIRKEEKNMYWTGYTEAPDYEKFKQWFLKRIQDKNRLLYLLFEDGKCAGSLNIDYYPKYAAIGYSVKTGFEGKGLATKIVADSIQIIKKSIADRPDLERIIARINDKNTASIKVVLKNGFHKSHIKEMRKRFGKDELYHQYHFEL